MSERPSQTNLRRLDGKAESVTFAARLKLFWAPIATIGVIIGGTATAVVATTKPFTKKADASTLAAVRKQVEGDDDRIERLETRVDDLQHGQDWLQQTLYVLSLHQGVEPAPIPTPHPVPTETPR